VATVTVYATKKFNFLNLTCGRITLA